MNSCDCKTREPGDESPTNLSAAPVDRPSRINWDVEQSISAHFEAVTQHHPKHRAIGSGQWQPTYEELNGVANSLARALVSRGLKSGDRVAILMRQDGTSIAAIIGVLKAGGIVVVMNSSDPQVRLDQIFADAEPRLVITDSANHELAVRVAKNDVAVVSFDPRSSAPELNLNLTIAPDALAFLIYTSGTSGKPKGVMQSQRTVLHNALRLSRGLEVTDEDRIILLASPSGGQGVSTIWCALSNGAAAYPFAASEQGIGRLKDWMNANKITIYVSAVSIYRHFMKSLTDEDVLPYVRLVRLGAEKAIASDFAAFRKHFSNQCILLNSLSSSETGNVAQHRFDYGNTPSGGALPVGMPATGMEILLLDDHGREVAPDQIGEIIVRSRYLSPGYWRNEALTAERFSCDPASDGAWRFRTGDFGRKDATGALIFTDRKDNRVKINGYRIELAEVENALNTLSGVHQAVVCARTDNGGNTKLVGYVVPRAGEERSSTDLRQKLFSLLPNYMAPSQFIFLDELPLTPQGKLDYQRLPPAPDANNASRTILPPRDVVERNLVKVFETVLAISPVSRSDDFF